VECISTDGHGVLNAVSGFLISLTNFMMIEVHVHSTFSLTSAGRIECAKNITLHSADEWNSVFMLWPVTVRFDSFPPFI